LRLRLSLRPKIPIGPLEVGDARLDLVVRKILSPHRHLVLGQYLLANRITLRHPARIFHPALQPRLMAPLCDVMHLIVPLACFSRSDIEHNVGQSSRETPLRLYTLYSPPEHPHGTVHRTKRDEPAGH